MARVKRPRAQRRHNCEQKTGTETTESVQKQLLFFQ